MPNFRESNKVPSISEMLREGLSEGKSPSLTVSSDSMSPLLRKGDVIGLSKVNFNDFYPGQIITFAYKDYPQDIITHRFAGFLKEDGNKNILTWADRTLMFDAPFDQEDIIGRVVWRRRFGEEVSLENGKLAWLSSHLYSLACWELKRITNLDLNEKVIRGEDISKSELLRKKAKGQNVFRILRRLCGYWARSQSFVIDKITYT